MQRNGLINPNLSKGSCSCRGGSTYRGPSELHGGPLGQGTCDEDAPASGYLSGATVKEESCSEAIY